MLNLPAQKMADTTPQLRIDVAQLLTNSPADAMASYFALEHDPRRTKLFVRTDPKGRTLAFVAVCQTGIDLFRPLVLIRSVDSSALRDALSEALAPNRHYLLSATPSLRPDIVSIARLQDETINLIYTLSAADFKPIVNILAQSGRTPDGMLRATISTRDGNLAAEAGTSWISSKYGELYVKTEEAFRGRGLGKSVVSAVCVNLLEIKKTPLYITDQDNVASQKLAERLGCRNTGAYELSGAVTIA
jgi:RimJ/RimL family protein N-acetyltransferase